MAATERSWSHDPKNSGDSQHIAQQDSTTREWDTRFSVGGLHLNPVERRKLGYLTLYGSSLRRISTHGDASCPQVTFITGSLPPAFPCSRLNVRFPEQSKYSSCNTSTPNEDSSVGPENVIGWEGIVRTVAGRENLNGSGRLGKQPPPQNRNLTSGGFPTPSSRSFTITIQYNGRSISLPRQNQRLLLLPPMPSS